ncbi:hypothetical protein B0H16DRAFT_1721683 [Mycena metata]|uniref:Uncharacterized protein n=1 Tax=Mycena metata TaxID=1033252 RepID=A0AAD7NDY1_9AGAR|nr:hypothetical protein B0H16DRAFT_1721683 [Mycena metata]
MSPNYLSCSILLKQLPQDEAVYFLPVLYARIDPDLTPALETLDEILTTGTGLRDVAPNLWRCVWPWANFVHTHWTQLFPGSVDTNTAVYLSHSSIMLWLATHSEVSKLIATTLCTIGQYPMPDAEPVLVIQFISELTVDGLESQMATDHIGPFPFTKLLMPKPRAMFLSSSAHAAGTGVNFKTFGNPDSAAYHIYILPAGVPGEYTSDSNEANKDIAPHSCDPGSLQNDIQDNAERLWSIAEGIMGEGFAF